MLLFRTIGAIWRSFAEVTSASWLGLTVVISACWRAVSAVVGSGWRTLVGLFLRFRRFALAIRDASWHGVAALIRATALPVLRIGRHLIATLNQAVHQLVDSSWRKLASAARFLGGVASLVLSVILAAVLAAARVAWWPFSLCLASMLMAYMRLTRTLSVVVEACSPWLSVRARLIERAWRLLADRLVTARRSVTSLGASTLKAAIRTLGILFDPLWIVAGWVWRGFASLARSLARAARDIAIALWLGLGSLGRGFFAIVSPVFVVMIEVLALAGRAVARVAGGVARFFADYFQAMAVVVGWSWTAVTLPFRVVWYCITAVPASLRAIATFSQGQLAPNISGVRMSTGLLMTFGTIAGLLILGVSLLKPEPSVTVVHWTTGHLLRDGSGLRMLRQMAEEFNDAELRTTSGKKIKVEVYYAGGADQAPDLISRITKGTSIDPELPDPTMVTPSASHWMVNVNHAAGREVIDLSDTLSRSLARSYVGIVTYREMAECLGWPEKEIGYADIIAFATIPRAGAVIPIARRRSGARSRSSRLPTRLHRTPDAPYCLVSMRLPPEKRHRTSRRKTFCGPR